MPQDIRLAAIGWRASAALASTGGTARVLASLTGSTYLDAGGEILWLGGRDSIPHARAMLPIAAPSLASVTVTLDRTGLDPWRPRPIVSADTAHLRRGAMALLRELRRQAWAGLEPAGLGLLLAGKPVPFTLERCVGAVSAMADACDRDSPAAVATAGEPLIGLGPGLTPSGDDFVGGVLFARRILTAGNAAWSEVATRLLEKARVQTHWISAALLADLARGEGHEPLHNLVAALASPASDEAQREVRRLARLGHSSGWDVLTGALVGFAGSAALPRAGLP